MHRDRTRVKALDQGRGTASILGWSGYERAPRDAVGAGRVRPVSLGRGYHKLSENCLGVDSVCCAAL
jgi:hypothetical protein